MTRRYKWREVRRQGGVGSAPTAGAGSRERAAEGTAGRSDASYGSVEGGRPGKALSPQAKREAVAAILEKVNIS